MMKRAQERIKSLIIDGYASVGKLPKNSAFNPLKIKKSAGAVDVYDEEVIPKDYYVEVQTERLDKKRILDELKDGKKVPGVRLKKNQFVGGLK